MPTKMTPPKNTAKNTDIEMQDLNIVETNNETDDEIKALEEEIIADRKEEDQKIAGLEVDVAAESKEEEEDIPEFEIVPDEEERYSRSQIGNRFKQFTNGVTSRVKNIFNKPSNSVEKLENPAPLLAQEKLFKLAEAIEEVEILSNETAGIGISIKLMHEKIFPTDEKFTALKNKAAKLTQSTVSRGYRMNLQQARTFQQTLQAIEQELSQLKTEYENHIEAIEAEINKEKNNKQSKRPERVLHMEEADGDEEEQLINKHDKHDKKEEKDSFEDALAAIPSSLPINSGSTAAKTDERKRVRFSEDIAVQTFQKEFESEEQNDAATELKDIADIERERKEKEALALVAEIAALNEAMNAEETGERKRVRFSKTVAVQPFQQEIESEEQNDAATESEDIDIETLREEKRAKEAALELVTKVSAFNAEIENLNNRFDIFELIQLNPLIITIRALTEHINYDHKNKYISDAQQKALYDDITFIDDLLNVKNMLAEIKTFLVTPHDLSTIATIEEAQTTLNNVKTVFASIESSGKFSQYHTTTLLLDDLRSSIVDIQKKSNEVLSTLDDAKLNFINEKHLLDKSFTTIKNGIESASQETDENPSKLSNNQYQLLTDQLEDVEQDILDYENEFELIRNKIKKIQSTTITFDDIHQMGRATLVLRQLEETLEAKNTDTIQKALVDIAAQAVSAIQTKSKTDWLLQSIAEHQNTLNEHQNKLDKISEDNEALKEKISTEFSDENTRLNAKESLQLTESCARIDTAIDNIFKTTDHLHAALETLEDKITTEADTLTTDGIDMIYQTLRTVTIETNKLPAAPETIEKELKNTQEYFDVCLLKRGIEDRIDNIEKSFNNKAKVFTDKVQADLVNTKNLLSNNRTLFAAQKTKLITDIGEVKIQHLQDIENHRLKLLTLQAKLSLVSDRASVEKIRTDSDTLVTQFNAAIKKIEDDYQTTHARVQALEKFTPYLQFFNALKELAETANIEFDVKDLEKILREREADIYQLKYAASTGTYTYPKDYADKLISLETKLNSKAIELKGKVEDFLAADNNEIILRLINTNKKISDVNMLQKLGELESYTNIILKSPELKDITNVSKTVKSKTDAANALNDAITIYLEKYKTYLSAYETSNHVQNTERLAERLDLMFNAIAANPDLKESHQLPDPDDINEHIDKQAENLSLHALAKRHVPVKEKDKDKVKKENEKIEAHFKNFSELKEFNATFNDGTPKYTKYVVNSKIVDLDGRDLNSAVAEELENEFSFAPSPEKEVIEFVSKQPLKNRFTDGIDKDHFRYNSFVDEKIDESKLLFTPKKDPVQKKAYASNKNHTNVFVENVAEDKATKEKTYHSRLVKISDDSNPRIILRDTLEKYLLDLLFIPTLDLTAKNKNLKLFSEAFLERVQKKAADPTMTPALLEKYLKDNIKTISEKTADQLYAKISRSILHNHRVSEKSLLAELTSSSIRFENEKLFSDRLQARQSATVATRLNEAYRQKMYQPKRYVGDYSELPSSNVFATVMRMMGGLRTFAGEPIYLPKAYSYEHALAARIASKASGIPLIIEHPYDEYLQPEKISKDAMASFRELIQKDPHLKTVYDEFTIDPRSLQQYNIHTGKHPAATTGLPEFEAKSPSAGTGAIPPVVPMSPASSTRSSTVDDSSSDSDEDTDTLSPRSSRRGST